MSELTVTAIRLGLLALLWAFVFSIVGVLKGDLYGARTVLHGSLSSGGGARQQPRRRSLSQLAVVEGHMRGTTVPLTENGVLIGRNPECSLVLSDEFASGRHARVYAEGDQWWIDDLGSTNGTYVGPQRIDEHVPLHEGSRIRIGTTVLEVRK